MSRTHGGCMPNHFLCTLRSPLFPFPSDTDPPTINVQYAVMCDQRDVCNCILLHLDLEIGAVGQPIKILISFSIYSLAELRKVIIGLDRKGPIFFLQPK